jgi:phage virion morphogenesis protein
MAAGPTSAFVKVDDRTVSAALAKLRARLGDMTPVYTRIGATIEGRVQMRFDTRTAPSGKPWAPWSDRTAAMRKREGRGSLLVYTGHMRTSLSYRATRDWVRIGFTVPYAKYHEFGTRRGKRRHIPARPMLFSGRGLGAGDKSAVMGVLKSWLRATK